MKSIQPGQNDVNVTVTNYRIETTLDNGSSSRSRLLILTNGERKGSIVIDSEEEGQEIIRKLSGEPAGIGMWGRMKAAAGRRAGVALSVLPPKLSTEVVPGERLIWLVLITVSWAITFATLTAAHIL